MKIAGNFLKLETSIPKNVKIIAVSKTKPVEDIMVLYQSGHKIFGENKVQEITSKYNALPKDIEWHFIGHLQTNKVKYIVPFVSIIHGIDNMKLLKTVNKEGEKNNRVIDCLIQFHIATEETKYGMSLEEAKNILESDEFSRMCNIRIKGVMGMATFTNDQNLIRNEFSNLKKIFEHLKNNYFNKNEYFSEISMGMSDDYRIAIEEGSTMIRIGSLIFGERNNKNNQYI